MERRWHFDESGNWVPAQPMEDYLAQSLALNQARVDACIQKAKDENRPPKGEHILTVRGIPELPAYLLTNGERESGA